MPGPWEKYGAPQPPPANAAPAGPWEKYGGAQQPPPEAPTFGQRLYETTVGPIVQTVTHPIDTLKGTAAGVFGVEDLSQVLEHVRQGNFKGAAAYLMKYAYEGPGGRMAHGMVDPIVEDVRQGHYGAAAGGALGSALSLAGPEVLPKVIPKVMSRVPTVVGPLFQSHLNPVAQSAINYLKSEGVPMKAGTQTGNKFLRSAEAVTAHSPFGAQAAEEFNRGTLTGIQQVGERLKNRLFPSPTTPESAGAGIRQGMESNIAGLKGMEDINYRDAWTGRGQPQFTYDMPVGRDASGGVIMKPVNMPVEIIDLKRAAGPLLDEMRFLTKAQKASHPAYAVLSELMTMDDYVPAWMAERALSGLKEMARIENPNLRNVSQGTAAGLIPELQRNIDAAVANTGQSAVRGLNKGRAFAAQKAEVAELYGKLREEPVQTFRQMTWEHDTGIDFLRKIRNQVGPQAMKEVGRAWFQDLLREAERRGGFDKTKTLENAWHNLGPETQKILAPDTALRSNIEDFLRGADLVAEPINPSGTQLVKEATTYNPARWAGGYLGSKLFYTPEGIKLLTEGLPIGQLGPVGERFARMAGRTARVPVLADAARRNEELERFDAANRQLYTTPQGVPVYGAAPMTATNPQTGQRIESTDGGKTWRIAQ